MRPRTVRTTGQWSCRGLALVGAMLGVVVGRDGVGDEPRLDLRAVVHGIAVDSRDVLKGQAIQIEVTLFDPGGLTAEWAFAEARRSELDLALREGRAPREMTFEPSVDSRRLLPAGGLGWLDHLELSIHRLGDAPGEPSTVWVEGTFLADAIADHARRSDGRDSSGALPVDLGLTLSPDVAAGLDSGTYVLRAVYDTASLHDEETWKGRIAKESAPFKVRVARTPHESLLLRSSRMGFLIGVGRDAEALAEAEAIVRDDPSFGRYGCYVTIGNLKMKAGDYAGAKIAFETFLAKAGTDGSSRLPTLVRHRLAICDANLGSG